MFWNLVLAEQQRLFRRPLVLVEGGILALLVLGMSVALYAINARMPESPMPAPVWSDTTTTMLQIACTSLVGGVLVVVLVGAVTAQAYQWRTIHLWVSHGAPRGMLLWAKVLAVLVAVLLVPLVALVVGGAVTAILLAQREGGVINVGDLSLVALLTSVLYGVVSVLPYAALALLLAVTTRSTVAPIGGGIGFIIAETLGSSLLGNLGSPGMTLLTLLLPSGLSTVLMQGAHVTGEPMAASSPGRLPMVEPWVALAGLLVWTGALLVPAFWVFRTQDLPDS